jgi:hypothetical protein
MTSKMKLMTNAAVALGLIGTLAFSAATPTLAQSVDRAHVLVNRAPHHNPNGYSVGTDPDPFIRDMLRHDPPRG